MIIVGIVYVILSIPYFVNKKINSNLNIYSQKIYFSLFCTGISIIILYLFKFLIPMYLYYLIFMLLIFSMILYVRKVVKTMIIVNKVVEKLTKK
jgi:hypothetical protein